MIVRKITLDEWTALVNRVSSQRYDGNIIVDRDARQEGVHAPRVHGRIIAMSSSGTGARRRRNGRRSTSACWHVFRDVLGAFFDLHPDALVTTMVARYEGRDGFLDAFPATAFHNKGSMVDPVPYASLCDCDDALLAEGMQWALDNLPECQDHSRAGRLPLLYLGDQVPVPDATPDPFWYPTVRPGPEPTGEAMSWKPEGIFGMRSHP